MKATDKTISLLYLRGGKRCTLLTTTFFLNYYSMGVGKAQFGSHFSIFYFDRKLYIDHSWLHIDIKNILNNIPLLTMYILESDLPVIKYLR